MRRLVAIAMVTGCGFGAPPGATPTGDDVLDPDGPVAGDDAAVPRSCLERWHAGQVAFDPPVRLDAVSIANEIDRDPWLSADGRTLVFSSARSSEEGDIFVSQRTGPDAGWSTPAIIASLSSGSSDESKVSFTADAAFGVIASSQDNSSGGGPTDLFVVRNTNAGPRTPLGPWTPADQNVLNDLNTNQAEYDPWLSGDGLRLYFSPGNGGQQIAVATRSTLSDGFGAPTQVDLGIGNNGDPSLSADERVLLFTSTRADPAGDLYFATRATGMPLDGFSSPVALSALNDPAFADSDATLSADGCELIFASSREGSYDLFVARMQ